MRNKLEKHYAYVEITSSSGDAILCDGTEEHISSPLLANLPLGSFWTILYTVKQITVLELTCEHIEHTPEELEASRAALGITPQTIKRYYR